MKLPLPIKSQNKPIITQGYGDTRLVEWYKANGVNIPMHNGVDFVVGTDRITFGTPLVCPFETAKVVKVTFDTPTSTKGNGVTIEGVWEGKTLQVVFWHTSEVSAKTGDNLKFGDTICYIGNSGLCNPPRTEDNPFAGSHLHLMVFEWTGTAWKGIDTDMKGAMNPCDYFNTEAWFVTDKDSGNEHDIPAISEKLKTLDILGALKYILKFFKITR